MSRPDDLWLLGRSSGCSADVAALSRGPGQRQTLPPRGSGLTGLRDRIEAVGGTLEVTSPAGGGTTLLIEIPG